MAAMQKGIREILLNYVCKVVVHIVVCSCNLINLEPELSNDVSSNPLLGSLWTSIFKVV